MIINYFIPPHPSLQPFVDNYVLCTSEGKKITLKSTWPASNETSLIFYLSDRPYHHTGEHAASPLQNQRGCIVGLLSHCNGTVSFGGIYHTFLIQFKANGFNKLFRMQAAEFVNKIFYLDDVFGKSARELNEALQLAEDIQQMARFADKFLLHFLNLQKAHITLYDGITFISNELFTKVPMLTIGQYAHKANMSVRNFGRRFTEQTGVSPKLYCRLLRFNNAINVKMKNPQSNWTSVAYECGYYDQMHMIKDFREFANVNPGEFFQSNKEFTRPGIDLTGADSNTFSEPVIEKFVMVNRTTF
ncbi:MAG TPA: AraC family transcriptional regulator [Panacibacter sp.]|nr:AraC family transcriptional regulator [Panacibacter sp.]